MPKFRYTGDVERIFPGDGTRDALVVKKGNVVTADENPDPAFFVEETKTKSSKED